jgi:hypothetical protein
VVIAGAEAGDLEMSGARWPFPQGVRTFAGGVYEDLDFVRKDDRERHGYWKSFALIVDSFEIYERSIARAKCPLSKACT